jgi:hypothetical protein
MNNLTPQEIQELLEMGIDPSSVVSAYNEANFGTFVDNTVGKIKSGVNTTMGNLGNMFNTPTPQVSPLLPTPSGGASDPTPNMYAPFATQNDESNYLYSKQADQAASLQKTRDAQDTTMFQKMKAFGNKAEDYLKDKYQDKIKNGKSFKPFDKTMQGLMGGISYGAGMNQAAQVQEQNRMANQSAFKEAGNTKEYYNNDFVGENDPLFFLNSRDGAKAEPMYAANGVPIEAEGGEFYLDPSSGATIPIHGPSHEEGGVKMVAEQGSYIMSDNVKIPGSFVNDMLKKNALPVKKQYTISDVIRQFPQHFDTKLDAEKLADKSLDSISKNSYEMNMKKKLANVSKLLAYQQTMNGGHGEDKGPEARYGMEINGGAPLSFDYRADELRVKDMMKMQQEMPIADKGNKNTTPKFKTKEEADAYYADKAGSASLDQKAAYQQWYLNEAKKLKPGEVLDVVAPENLGPYAGLKYQVKADDLTRYNDQQGQNYMPTSYGLDSKGTYVLPNLNAFQSEWQSQNSATGYGGIDWSPQSAQWFDFTRRHPEIASKYEGKLNDPSQMSAMQQDLIKKLVDHGADISPEMMRGLADVKGGRMTWSVPSFMDNPPPPPDKKRTSTFTENIPEKEKEKPKGKPYQERLPLGQYMGLLPSPRTQNYLPEYRQERYEPNLVSLRSAKNDQVAAMNSMLQQQGMNPATMAARQASLYGEAAKNIGAITEQENNTNAQILNQAKAQNAQTANQTNAMQQAANRQYVTENAQDLAALDNDRYKKLNDLYQAQQKVNQYNKTLSFIDQNMAKNMDITIDANGNPTITRNQNAAVYNSNDAAANLRAMATPVTQTPSTTTPAQTTTPGGRYGRKNTK